MYQYNEYVTLLSKVGVVQNALEVSKHCIKGWSILKFFLPREMQTLPLQCNNRVPRLTTIEARIKGLLLRLNQKERTLFFALLRTLPSEQSPGL
jgi:hypothetical protein